MKWLLRIFAGVLLIVTIAWLSFPWWAGSMVSLFVPQGWKLESAEFHRPVFSKQEISSLRLSGTAIDQRIRLEVEELRIEFRGPEISATVVSLGLEPVSETAGSEPLKLDDLAIPDLLLPLELPPVSIGELRLNLSSLGADPVILRDLSLGQGEQQPINIAAEIDRVPGFISRGSMRLAISEQELEISLELADPGGGEIELRQYRDAGMHTELTAVLDLARVDPVLWEAVLKSSGLGGSITPDTPTVLGQARLVARFGGDDRQLLQDASIGLSKLLVHAGSTRLGGGGHLEARPEGQSISVSFVQQSGLSLKRSDGIAPAWLLDPLNDLGIELMLLSGEPQQLSLLVDEGSGARISLDSPAVIEFTGSATVGANHGADHKGELRLAPSSSAELSFHEEAVRVSVSGHMDWNLAAGNGLKLRSEGQQLSLHGFHGKGGGELTISDSAVSSINDSNYVLAFDNADLELADSTERLTVGQSTMSGSFDFDNAGGTLVTTGTGQLNRFDWAGQGISADELQLNWDTFDVLKLVGGVGIKTYGLLASVEGTEYSTLDIEAELALRKDGALAGPARLYMGSSLVIPFRLGGNLNSGLWEMTLDNAPITAAQIPQALNAAQVAIPKLLRFQQGTIYLSGQVSYGSGIGGAMQLKGDALQLAIAESVLEAADFEAEVELAALNARGRSEAVRFALAADLDLLNPRGQFSYGPNTGLTLSTLGGQLCGGDLYLPQIIWHENAIQPATIHWTGVRLEQLVPLFNTPGLSALGGINAQLPLEQHGAGIAIVNGTFAAEGSGKIAYTSGVPASNIGLQALENFQYESLSGTVDYTPDGPYKIGIEMLGRNPDLYGGHPVLFRLNVGGELPALFKSLFLTGDFSEAILENLRMAPGNQP